MVVKTDSIDKQIQAGEDYIEAYYEAKIECAIQEAAKRRTSALL
jgi:hypothetical protein